MGKTFARIHASSVGKFEKGDKIAQWIRYNGGQFSREVHDGVTHLISSPAAYKENAEAGNDLHCLWWSRANDIDPF